MVEDAGSRGSFRAVTVDVVVDPIRLAFAAFLVGCLPGWFWSKVLSPGGGSGIFHLVYSVALSAALVSTVTLASIRFAGSGVTIPILVFAATTVFVTGFAAFLVVGPDDGPVKNSSTPLARPPEFRPTLGVLAPLVVASVPMLCIISGLVPVLWGLPLTAVVMVYAALRLHADSGTYKSTRLPEDDDDPYELGLTDDSEVKERGLLSPEIHRVLLGVVLALVLVRGYVGPIVHDWPFVRGVDQYNHAVMANEMLLDGRIFPYLIYPPGFHTMTANVSLLSGIEPLEVFPILAPALLLLPTLSLYTLARRLWGPDYGLAAAGFAGLVAGGSYQYFSDAMYPNMFTSQFLLVLSIAGLLELYNRPSIRSGLLFTLLGSSVILYHQVASLYLTLLLIPVGAYFLYRFYYRDLRGATIIFASILTLCALSTAYTWDTYDLPKLIGRLLGGEEEKAATGEAVTMTIGTQAPFSFNALVGIVLTQPVAWLGLLGVVLLLNHKVGGVGSRLRFGRFAKFTVLAWVIVFAVGSVNPLTGFPQRFARDLGMPFALLASLAFVSLVSALASSRRFGRPSPHLALMLGASLMAAAIGLQVMFDLKDSTSIQTPLTFTNGLTVTPEIAVAGGWLKDNNTGNGNVMVSPQGNQVPSRMMLAMSRYSAMQSYPADSILANRDLPPSGAGAMWDVLHVMKHPSGKRTRQLLQEYDVRHVVLYKALPDRPVVPYWRGFRKHPNLYRVVFENEDVLILVPR